MENGSNCGKTRNELWETNKSEIDFIKDKLCVEDGFLKEKCKKIIEEKNIEEFLSTNLTANVWTNIVNLSDSIAWYYMVFVNIPSNGKMMSLVLRLYSQLLEYPSQL